MFTAVAELTVLRALELAGERIIRWAERSSRGPLKAFKPISVHVQRPVKEADLDEVLPKGAWAIPAVAGLPDELIEVLDRHTRILLVVGLEFRREDLILTLSRLPLEKMPLPWLPA
ncbi:hypothetical protein QQY66_33495 [Streptomyces sp. DG2A-72]|uniref:hypothetical protein n=1 Tax=Streptomyces sp. DG2A-72 TaxID=3051386 RepID=UPI00265BC728|nr:hypothetical protein [Streptomyces sp. DG2A-72]MDO0936377.1 hypothetical protein [Streptomyces sp. DG2A-72]